MEIDKIIDLAKVVKDFKLESIEVDGVKIKGFAPNPNMDSEPEPLSAEALEVLEKLSGHGITDEEILADPYAGLGAMDKAVEK